MARKLGKQKFIKAKDVAEKLGYKEAVMGRYGVFVRGKIRKKKSSSKNKSGVRVLKLV